MAQTTAPDPFDAIEPLVDLDVVAEHLGVSDWNVRNLMREQGLPYIRVSRRAPRFRMSEIEAWLAERRVNAS